MNRVKIFDKRGAVIFNDHVDEDTSYFVEAILLYGLWIEDKDKTIYYPNHSIYKIEIYNGKENQNKTICTQN